MEDRKPIIEMRQLTKKFGGLVAVDSVDLDIYPGEVTAIVGSNGAGKSTLIQMLSGFHQPTSGEIHFRGEPLPLGDPLRVKNLGIETDLHLALDHCAKSILGSIKRESAPPFIGRFMSEEIERPEDPQLLEA